MTPAPVEPSTTPGGRRSRGGAMFVALGILLSRLSGLARQRALAHYFGMSLAAAAFSAALRIPNFLQNLFGEGVLSASFIPVYASLLESDRREEADRVAGAVFGLLALVVGLLSALGMVGTPWLLGAIAPGFRGEEYELTLHLVRIVFPGTALLVLSAWCLGVLNSHRRFFLSYAAPVLWNATIIVALLAWGRSQAGAELAVVAAWAVALGSLLQFAVQLPSVLALLGHFRPSLDVRSEATRQVLRGFVPVVIARGVVQLSAYVDLAYASLLSDRAFAALSHAQTIYLLPISLFGMSVSAAELPEMSRVSGTSDEIAAALRARIERGLSRIAALVVPSAIALLMLGDVVAAVLFETGRFQAADSRYVWYILMGSSVGLLAATMGRLYTSAFYALRDPRTPLKLAIVRVTLTAALAFYSVRYLPAQLGLPRDLGAVGITASTGFVAWLEYLLLAHLLRRRIGPVGIRGALLARLWGSALFAGAMGLGAKWLLGHSFGVRQTTLSEWGGWLSLPPALHPAIAAAVILGTFGLVYLGALVVLKIPLPLGRRSAPAGRSGLA